MLRTFAVSAMTIFFLRAVRQTQTFRYELYIFVFTSRCPSRSLTRYLSLPLRFNLLLEVYRNQQFRIQ